MPSPSRLQLDPAARTRHPESGAAPQRPLRRLDAVAWQRAGLAASNLRPADVLGLQAALGNRAVGRLLMNWHEAHEHEADTIAQRVAGGDRPAGLHETSDDTSVVAPRIEAGINAARGAGSPLPGPLRAQMQQALGADLGGVRLHTDERAHRLSQALRARAFTTGADVFFRHGEFDPAHAPGRQVLAHELAHVVQQRRGQPAAEGRPGLAPAPAGAVQRLVSVADFKKLAGSPSTSSKVDKGTYTKILKQLESYEKDTGAKRPHILAELKRLCVRWLDKHTRWTSTAARADIYDYEDAEVKDKANLRKFDYIEALLAEVRIEMGELKNSDAVPDTPSELTADITQVFNATRGAITLDLNSDPAHRYELTLVVSMENPDLIAFQEKRLALTIKSTDLFGKSKLNNQEIKLRAARAVIDEKQAASGKAMSDAQKQTEAARLAGRSSEIGHAWVHLRKFNDKGTALADHSFGFYPVKHYSQPDLAVPGYVLYGDRQHAMDPDQLAKRFAVSRAQYEAGLQHALDVMARRPDYKATDYNCTRFAKDVVEAAGQAYPDRAYMKVPTGPLSAVTGLGWAPAHNPNKLYEQLRPRASARQSVFVPMGASSSSSSSTTSFFPSTTASPAAVPGALQVSRSESEASEADVDLADHLELLQACVGKPLKLASPVMAMRHTEERKLPAGTDIRIKAVDHFYLSCDFEVARDHVLHETEQLGALCAALGLG